MVEKFLIWLAVVVGIAGTVMTSFVCYSYWPEKDSSLPAWIQAIGSVAAIFVAIGVMNFQQDQAKTQKEIDRVEVQMNLAAALENCARRLVDVLDDIRVITDGRKLSKTDLGYCRSQLTHVLAVLELVPVVGMHNDDVKHAGDLSVCCSQVITYAQLVKENLPNHARTLHTQVSEQLIDANTALDSIKSLRVSQQARLDKLVG